MAETKEPEVPVVAEEQPTTQPPEEAEQKKKKQVKAAPKEKKKPKAAPKEKKPKPAKTASHPPYFQMIKEAIEALKEKSGSSPYAIAKYMEEKHKSVLPDNFRKILALQLKNSAAKGKLLKVKASYKLATSSEKKVTRPKPEPKEKKQAPAAAPRRRTKSVNKAVTEKKPAAGGKRKAAVVAAATPSKKKPKKSVPAKPKSIKSPAAKRARKASVAV